MLSGERVRLARRRWRPAIANFFQNAAAAKIYVESNSAMGAEMGTRVPVRCPEAYATRLRALFDRRADLVAPFGPGTVVVPDVIEA